jgi:hypothetical protein
MNGIKAFREAYFDADAQDMTLDSDWGDADARAMRYDLLWAYYQGNAYRNINTWARKYRHDYGLYRYTRDLYNPAAALATFYETYIWGGNLDPNASADLQSALPIETENERLRPAIARLWRDSNWATQRNIVPLWGSAMGDAFVGIVDDTRRQMVRMQVIHPAHISRLEKDANGNVKAYVIEYKRTDDLRGIDLAAGKVNDTGIVEVDYKEVVTRDGDNIVYRLYKNGSPYAWGNESAEWAVPYGFVPMVHFQHHDVGMFWGMAEAHPKLSLFRETDDLASKLDDQVRKIVDALWLFTGTQEATLMPSVAPQTTADGGQDEGRDQLPALYSINPDTRAIPLVAPLQIADALEVIREHGERMKQFYPELQIGTDNEGGVRSGEAERERHKAAENKALARRAGYDAKLEEAQRMGVAIGGWRGYDGYEGFDLDSYERGDLDHSIGNREVFQRGEGDILALLKSKVEIMKGLIDSGFSEAGAAKVAGFTDEEVEMLTDFSGVTE